MFHFRNSFAGLILLSLFIFNSCGILKHNRFKNGQQHGYWVTYADNEKKIVLTKGQLKKVFKRENGFTIP